VITVADNVVELRRSGDGWLVGSFRLKDGRTFPVSLVKAAPSAEFDEERIVAAKLVGTYDGAKQGFGVRTPDDDFARVLSVDGVGRGATGWKATARLGHDRDRLAPWATTLTVTENETSVVLAAPWGGEIALRLLSPGHLVGSIRQPAGKRFAISFKRVADP
jgi:hypothetical protein